MPIFLSLKPNKGKIAGSTAKKEMVKSRLPNPVLAKVWRLADVDGDGALDSDEFALAMHLIHIKLDGFDMPDQLPDHLVPPSKKKAMMEAAAKAAANHVDPNQVSNTLVRCTLEGQYVRKCPYPFRFCQICKIYLVNLH